MQPTITYTAICKLVSSGASQEVAKGKCRFTNLGYSMTASALAALGGKVSLLPCAIAGIAVAFGLACAASFLLGLRMNLRRSC